MRADSTLSAQQRTYMYRVSKDTIVPYFHLSQNVKSAIFLWQKELLSTFSHLFYSMPECILIPFTMNFENEIKIKGHKIELKFTSKWRGLNRNSKFQKSLVRGSRPKIFLHFRVQWMSGVGW